jgi:hypothetical protein
VSKLDSPIQDALEDLVDQASLHDVLDALSTICYEKADHVRTTWQDIALARLWITNGTRLDALACTVEL